MWSQLTGGTGMILCEQSLKGPKTTNSNNFSNPSNSCFLRVGVFSVITTVLLALGFLAAISSQQGHSLIQLVTNTNS